MYITFLDSGTSAIKKLLKKHYIKSVLLSQDMCPEVVEAIKDLGINVFFASVNKIGQIANYEREYNRYLKKKNFAIIFSHPYGIYNIKKLNRLSKILKTHHLLINDCCLCHPLEILKKKLTLPTVISFGYSKVFDFGSGGAIISSSKVPFNFPSYIFKSSIKRFNKFFNINIKLFYSYKFEKISNLNFFLVLKEYDEILHNHKKNFINILKKNFKLKNYLVSPWRFIIFSKFKKKEINQLLALCKKKGVFFGSNYPLLKYYNDRVVIDYKKMNKLGWPINIFTDFRVNQQSIKKIVYLLKRRIK